MYFLIQSLKVFVFTPFFAAKSSGLRCALGSIRYCLQSSSLLIRVLSTARFFGFTAAFIAVSALWVIFAKFDARTQSPFCHRSTVLGKEEETRGGKDTERAAP